MKTILTAFAAAALIAVAAWLALEHFYGDTGEMQAGPNVRLGAENAPSE